MLFSGCQESYEVEENRHACVAGCKLQDHIPSAESYLEVSINHLYYMLMHTSCAMLLIGLSHESLEFSQYAHTS